MACSAVEWSAVRRSGGCGWAAIRIAWEQWCQWIAVVRLECSQRSVAMRSNPVPLCRPRSSAVCVCLVAACVRWCGGGRTNGAARKKGDGTRGPSSTNETGNNNTTIHAPHPLIHPSIHAPMTHECKCSGPNGDRMVAWAMSVCWPAQKGAVSPCADRSERLPLFVGVSVLPARAQHTHTHKHHAQPPSNNK